MGWTIKYYADPFGSPSSFVEKTFEDWGIGNAVLERKSFDTDELTFIAEGQAIDSASLFAYKSKIVVMRDRTVGGSDGTIYFQGYITAERRIGNYNSENVQYTASGVWWFLTKDCYEQQIPTLSAQPTTHIVLNMETRVPTYGSVTSIGAQTKDILDNAITRFGSIFAYDTADFTEFNSTYPPTSEKKDLTFAEALKEEFKWCPRAVSWIDYTVEPPKIHIKSINGISSVSVALGDGTTVSSGDIVPRYDLQISQAIIRYEETNRVDNVNFLSIFEDKYPPSASDNTAIMRATVNLYGYEGHQQSATISCRNLNTAINTDTWWKEKHPELNGYSALTFHYSGMVVTPSDGYDNELYEGCFHSWMRVGNTSGGDAGLQKTVVVKILVDYTDEYGNVFKNVELNARVKTTNLASGTFTRLTITSYAEPVPSGMAQWFYNNLSVLIWEGQITIVDEDIPSTQFLGKKLNITGGLSAWTTMGAVVNSTTESLDDGTLVVNFGVSKWLSPSEIIDLLRVTRSRQYTYWSSSITSGVLESDDTISPDNTVKDDSTKGSSSPEKTIVIHTF